MPSKLKKAIGAVKDQTAIGLAKVSTTSTSNNLDVAVLRATTHDDLPIDDRYVIEVLNIVSSSKIHAAACARAIGRRIGRTRNWVVALKSLMLVLRIFQDGDPYFPREVLHAMKRGAKILNLSSFRDGSRSSPWDFTSFVRTFALYLNERLDCFLTGKLQRRSVTDSSPLMYQRSKSRGARIEPIRDMKPAMLIDKMGCWQRLLDQAISTRPTGAAKTNNLVLMSLHVVVQETFGLYKDISDGLEFVLDSFFHLQNQNSVAAFQICVKAATQFKDLSGFYTMCRGLGVGRSSEYPTVQSISEELIESLQEFLKDQSSFPMKPTNQVSKVDKDSIPVSTEFGTQCASLEELISATESWTGPAISIDLEDYSETQRDVSFGISDTGSSRSLPVSSSITDLISLDGWSDEDDKKAKEYHQGQPSESHLQTSGSMNWELVLAETIKPSSSSSMPHITTNGEEMLKLPPPEESQSTSSSIWDLQLFPAIPVAPTLSDISTNNFSAFPEKPTDFTIGWELELFHPPRTENIIPAVNPPTTGWDLVLFQGPSPNTPPEELPPTNDHYNPFLTNPLELAVPEIPATFNSIPTFSVQNQAQNSHTEDPFAYDGAAVVGSSPVDDQNLLLQQQLWLQNQNKIMAKHFI